MKKFTRIGELRINFYDIVAYSPWQGGDSPQVAVYYKWGDEAYIRMTHIFFESELERNNFLGGLDIELL